MLAAKKRRSRSQFSSLSGDERQILRDKAVAKLQANDAQQKQAQVVEHDDRNRAAQQQANMQAKQQANSQRMAAAQQRAKMGGAPPKVGSGSEVNKQAGNPRQGKSFRSREVRGGEQHVYADGTRVFVRKQGAGGHSGGLQDAIKRVADQRAKMPAKGSAKGNGTRALFARLPADGGKGYRTGSHGQPIGDSRKRRRGVFPGGSGARRWS